MAELGYDITKKIGNGAFGAVYESSNGKVLKVLDNAVPSNRNELRMLPRLKHDNVVKVISRFPLCLS